MTDADESCPNTGEGDPTITIGILFSPNRMNHLDHLLRSISTAASRYVGDVEVVLGAESPVDVREAVADTINQPFRTVATNGTAPDGRSEIVEATDSEWLLFVDDDCVLDPGILPAYRDAIRTHERPIGAIYGMVEFAGEKPPQFDAYRFTPFIRPFQIASSRDHVEWGVTANALFSTTAVKDVGNFDRSNPIDVSGEDVDLGIRLGKAEYQQPTCADAVVYHTTETWRNFRGNLSRCVVYGESEAWLRRMHPDRSRPILGAGTRVGAGLRGGALAIFAILMLPLSACFWPLSNTAAWYGQGRPTSLRSYFLSDLYLLANYFGYARQVVRGPSPITNLLTRFQFYEGIDTRDAVRIAGPQTEPPVNHHPPTSHHE